MIRLALPFCLALLTSSLPARAQDTAQPAGDVVVCESLVALRVLMGEGEKDAVLTALPRHPACRRVPRSGIGLAEHRAMVGGAPFECLSIAGEARCAWVMP